MNNKYLNTLQKLLPVAAYDVNATNILTELTAEANALDTVNDHAISAVGAVTPFNAGYLLDDWERVLGLTTDTSQSYQYRLDLVLIKMAELGGLSIPYFITIAKKMGYDITITEGAKEIFRAGRNRAGDRLGAGELMWVWRVHVASANIKIHYFRAGLSRCGDRLRQYSDPIIEAVFNDLKPAFTFCTFTYV